jgi:hypothetical protein
MKIAVITAVWKRPEIFEIFAQHIHHLQETFKSEANIICIVAGSEGETSEKMVTAHGFNYIEIANDPLSEKHNSTLIRAKQLKVDYVLCLGSDDIIGDGLFRIYLDEINKKTDVVVLGDFYFYDYDSESAAYWGGYIDGRKGLPAGAGALLSARFLDIWHWRIWVLADKDYLDSSLFPKIATAAVKKRFLSLKANNVFAVDIKSSTNMTPLELWPNTKLIKSSIIKDQFKYLNL